MVFDSEICRILVDQHHGNRIILCWCLEKQVTENMIHLLAL